MAFDDDMRAVQVAEVTTKDTWFTSDVTFTDANGCWQIQEEYSGKMWMWVKFKNENVAAKDLAYWLTLIAVEDYVGRYDGPKFNNITVEYASGVGSSSIARRYWAAAHTLNTVNIYRTRAATDGIPLPKKGLNWINRAGNGDAAAPMLKGNLVNSTPSLLALYYPMTTVYYISAVPHLPDIINRYGDNEAARVFTNTGFHELGHASHYQLVGEGYWFDYRDHIICNHGYGTFPNFSSDCPSYPGHVALGEAIGNFTGQLYGSNNGEDLGWQDNFIPRGLMWDLRDDTPWEPVSGNIKTPGIPPVTGIDNISGFTPAMIFHALDPNVTDIRSFRDMLHALHLSETPNSIENYNTFVDIHDALN